MLAAVIRSWNAATPIENKPSVSATMVTRSLTAVMTSLFSVSQTRHLGTKSSCAPRQLQRHLYSLVSRHPLTKDSRVGWSFRGFKDAHGEERLGPRVEAFTDRRRLTLLELGGGYAAPPVSRPNAQPLRAKPRLRSRWLRRPAITEIEPVAL